MKYQITDIKDILSVFWHAGRGAVVDARPSFGFVICDGSAFSFFSGDKEYIADACHLLVLPKGAKYHFTCQKNGMTYTCNFDGQMPTKEPLSIPLRHDSRCLDAAREIAKTDNAYIQTGLLYRIIGDALGKCEDNIPKIIRPQIDHIHASLSQGDMTNAKLAAMTNVSEIYFRRIFTKAMGMPPHEYITNLRLEQAKMLLAGGESVSETATKCGFSSLYYFSSAFKKKVGLSPSAYAMIYGKI